VFGGTFPALIWHNYMSAALEGADVLSFTPPENVKPGQYLKLPTDKETRRKPAPRSGGGTGSPATTAPGGGGGGTPPPVTVAPPPVTAPPDTAPPDTTPPDPAN
jgi:hypothetical protein